MFMMRPSHMGRGIFLGIMVGGILGAGSILLTDKEKMRDVKRTMRKAAHVAENFMSNY